MWTSVTLDDEVFQALMEITNETNRTRAVQWRSNVLFETPNSSA